MIQEHADAILGLLRAVPGLTVYPVADGQPGSGTGIVPTGAAPPYVSVHVYTERPNTGDDGSGESLLGNTVRAITRAYCHCAGANNDAARAVAELVAGALLDVTPTVTGRIALPIRYDSGQPPRPDESTGRLIVDLVDVYRLETLPAS